MKNDAYRHSSVPDAAVSGDRENTNASRREFLRTAAAEAGTGLAHAGQSAHRHAYEPGRGSMTFMPGHDMQGTHTEAPSAPFDGEVGYREIDPSYCRLPITSSGSSRPPACPRPTGAYSSLGIRASWWTAPPAPGRIPRRHRRMHMKRCGPRAARTVNRSEPFGKGTVLPGKAWLVLVFSLLLGACDNGPAPAVSSTMLGVPTENLVRKEADPADLAWGRQLYRQHCAACHRENAEGDPNWRRRDPDGMRPPPALNGTAHAWHHPLNDLRRVIREGSPPGQGRMPAWKDTLSAAQIDAIILWLQSLWPDEVYAAWWRIDQRSRLARGEDGGHR